MRDRSTGDEKRARRIDVERLAPKFERAIGQRRPLQRIARVVEEHIQATDGKRKLVDDPICSRFVGQIGLQQHGSRAGLLDHPHRFAGFFDAGSIMDADRRAGFGESDGASTADADPCSGDEGRAAE